MKRALAVFGVAALIVAGLYAYALGEAVALSMLIDEESERLAQA